MASASYGHGWELVYKATRRLAIGNSDIKTRLVDAFIELSGLKKDELPTKLWQKFSSLYDEVTATHAIGDEGSIEASIRKMSDERATEIAGEVFGIFLDHTKTYWQRK